MTTPQPIHETVNQVVRALNLTKALQDAGLNQELEERIVIDERATGIAVDVLKTIFAAIPAQKTSSELTAETSIDDAGFTERVKNCLHRETAAETLGDLAKMTEFALINIPAFGEKSIREVKQALKAAGLTLTLA